MYRIMKKLLFILICAAISDLIVAQNDTGQPLFLTPKIQKGQIKFAINQARVQHKEIENIESYSGYFTVNEEYNSNLFFWYFPAEHDPANAPIILWLQGGPGVSSLVALFDENGPFRVNNNETLEERLYSWHRFHHVIYLDAPIGAGFSFTENKAGYARNSADVALSVRSGIVQFFELFSELLPNDFYIAGQSYAGKFVPVVGQVVKDYNDNALIKINLKGLIIESGFTDPLNQMKHSDYLYQVGLLDERGRDQVKLLENRIVDYIEQDRWLEAFNSFSKLMYWYPGRESSLFQNLTGFSHCYNYLFTSPSNFHESLYTWVQKSDVRKALHVGNYEFNIVNETTKSYLFEDFMRSVAPIVEGLLENYRFLIVYGQLDIVTAYQPSVKYLQKLNWSGTNAYLKADRRKWFVDEDLAGYTKTAGNLIEVLARNAGHLVATDQPRNTFDLITRFTRKVPF